MKTIYRLAAFVLFVTPLFSAPALMFAQSPFDGTWRTNMDQSTMSPKPYTASVKNGMYDCSSCSPTIHVKADGQEQSVTGQPYDTISVRKIDAKSIEVTTKKNGKPDYEQIRTVSDDGNTLSLKTTSHPPDSDKTVTYEASFTRIGKAPVGSEWGGSWQVSKLKASENGLMTTYKSNGDDLTMSTPIGESYTAKLDGKDYPVKGTYTYNSVSLKRIDDRTIERTDKRDSKVIEVSKITVAPDGKTMTVVQTNKLTDRTSTWVAEKQ
jgi:hypothetical protein